MSVCFYFKLLFLYRAACWAARENGLWNSRVCTMSTLFLWPAVFDRGICHRTLIKHSPHVHHIFIAYHITRLWETGLWYPSVYCAGMLLLWAVAHTRCIHCILIVFSSHTHYTLIDIQSTHTWLISNSLISFCFFSSDYFLSTINLVEKHSHTAGNMQWKLRQWTR